jgi:hypothetical protein
VVDVAKQMKEVTIRRFDILDLAGSVRIHICVQPICLCLWNLNFI